jgi:hypothetical protein
VLLLIAAPCTTLCRVASTARMPGPLNSGTAPRTLGRENVLKLTKRESLSEIRHLNAWGMQLEDVSWRWPEAWAHDHIVHATECVQVSIIMEMPNVEVLSLSVNCISSLEHFQHLHKLR